MAERIPIESLQTAVYGVLNTAFGTLSPAIPLYSFSAPQDVTYPFAVLSQFSFVPNNTKGSATQDATVTLEIYSESPSSTQINAAINKALETFTAAQLSMTDDFAEVFGVGEQETVEAFGSWDGERVIMQGIVKYRWTVEDTA